MRFFPFYLALSILVVPFHVTAAQIHEYDGLPVSTTVYVTFANGSTAFRPDGDDLQTLGSAKDAAMVTVRGRTSTNIPTARDEGLALARALAARSFLVRLGVSPLKIMVNFASAADFITANDTAAGRAENQRVEIELLHMPPSQ